MADSTPLGLAFGWVAAAGKDGEPWIAPVDYSCPRKPSNLTDLAALDGRIGVVCFGEDPITVEAELAPCLDIIEFTDDIDTDWFNPSNDISFKEPGGFSEGCPFLPAIDPRTGLTRDDLRDLQGSRLRITGMFDHPAARSCTFDTFFSEVHVDGPMGTIPCRSTCVVTEIERLS